MKHFKLTAMMLTLVLSFQAFAQEGLNEKYELAGQMLKSMRTQRDNPKAAFRFNAMLTQEINAELNQEASAHRMSRDEYLQSPISFDHFATHLKHISVSQMAPQDMTILLIKTSLRLDLQRSVHANGDYSVADEEIALDFQQSLLNKLQIHLPTDVD